MGCSTSLAKLFLFVFNIVFFLFGLASLILGIWVTVRRSDVFRLINLVDAKVAEGANQAEINAVANQGGTVATAGYVLIGLGLFTLLVGFCGCFGAMKESKCLLVTYAVLVSLVLIGEITAAIMAAAFQSRVRNTAIASIKKLQDKFFISMVDFAASGAKDGGSARALVTFLINQMQLLFECCGAETVGDIANSTSWTASNRTIGNETIQVPLTCCRLKSGAKGKVMSPAYNWTSLSEDLEQPRCMYTAVAENSGLNNQTCYSSLMNYVAQYAAPLIAVCVTIGLLELLGILLACCLIKSIENDISYAKQ